MTFLEYLLKCPFLEGRHQRAASQQRHAWTFGEKKKEYLDLCEFLMALYRLQSRQSLSLVWLNCVQPCLQTWR